MKEPTPLGLLFDIELGRTLRDVAMAHVEANSEPDFLEQAESALYRVAQAREMLTTDDVWRALGTGADTHERRVMGPVMMRGKANGWLLPTEQMASSAMVSCHCRRKRVWRSLIVQTGVA